MVFDRETMVNCVSYFPFSDSPVIIHSSSELEMPSVSIGSISFSSSSVSKSIFFLAFLFFFCYLGNCVSALCFFSGIYVVLLVDISSRGTPNCLGQLATTLAASSSVMQNGSVLVSPLGFACDWIKTLWLFAANWMKDLYLSMTDCDMRGISLVALMSTP